MIDLTPDLRALLSDLLRERRDEIIDHGTDWVIHSAGDLQGRRPRAETRALIAQEFDAYSDLLLAGDPTKRDAFIEHVTSFRASHDFKISTLLRGFLGFKRGVELCLEGHVAAPELALAARDVLDRLYYDTAFLMADVYVDKLLGLLRRTQQELLHREKMAALGGLVAGVAHEINTPMGIAVTAASLLHDRLSRLAQAFTAGELKRSSLAAFLSDGREAAELALTNLSRAAELVQSFKQIAVDQAHGAPRRLDLGAYVQEVLTSLAPLYKRGGHRLDLHLGAPFDAHVHAGAIAQILGNLIQNAVTHAFVGDAPGRMDVRLRLLEGARCELTFRDDGRGMSAEERVRVFEPFFTTRRGQGGSGLGMHIVHNLVTELMAGSIALESAPGGGTCITLIFPQNT